ncbi:hypothetical protein [Metabacillus halosaccharovorans]|uniref:hypothetical protein n=1 Tax=Metabacillus halosaccharovorans TaxID=930124 RepID=UPI002041EDB3|nr:hypothetical protein [Metabacillus halosaccharovorans]MCM3444364.1 hypothetical protein [Metabacillus halosaccharovorans]
MVYNKYGNKGFSSQQLHIMNQKQKSDELIKKESIKKKEQMEKENKEEEGTQ